MAEVKRKNIAVPEDLHLEIKNTLPLVKQINDGYSTDIQGFVEKALRDAIKAVQKQAAESNLEKQPA